MSMFTLAISCLTSPNLPQFMDLTFQVPMQYCSSQHQTLLPSPVTSTTGSCFCFGSVFSFFLELLLHFSLVYWAPTDLESSFFSVLSFCLFMLFMGFSRQEYWSSLPFPSPVDHILSKLSTMTYPSWLALHGMACEQISLSMGFSGQEDWGGLLCPSSGNLSVPGIEPTSILSPAWTSRFLPLAPPGKAVCEGLKYHAVSCGLKYQAVNCGLKYHTVNCGLK